MTSLVFECDDRWVEIDVEADTHEWSAEAAAEAYAHVDGEPEPERIAALAGVLAEIQSKLAGTGVGMAFLLLPDPDDEIVTVVSVRYHDRGPGDTVDDVTDTLLAPVEVRLHEPEISDVETRGGTARRVLQRFEDSEDQVIEQLVYVWMLDDSGVLTASTAFYDLVDAGIWRATIEELLESLVLEHD